MIPANELRIGNWFKVGEHWLQVHDISDTQNGVGMDPIPLAAEILEKCGFKRDRDGFYQLPINGGFIIECFATGGVVGSNQSTTKFAFNLIVGIGRQASSMTQFYLHQLQNIHFAITGEELNYKP